MSRPIKNGIDYFPLDVTFNYKIQLIEAEYGLEGFALIIKLFQLIYGEQGYYCQWNEDIILLFSRQNCVDPKTVDTVVNSALKRDIFSIEMYEKYGILTSAGIQSRYMEAKKRDYSRIYPPYALIEIPQNLVSDEKTEVSDEKTGVLECNNITKESKVNKNKIKENKVEERIEEESKKEKGVSAEKTTFTPPSLSDIEKYCNEQRIVIDCNKFYNHFSAKGWQINGTTLNNWKARVNSWYKEDMEKSRAAPKKAVNSFNNYSQRLYSEEQIDEMIRRKNNIGS